MRVTLHTKEDCPECDEVRAQLERLTRKYKLKVTETTAPPEGANPPVVQIEDVRIGRLVSPITPAEMEAYFHVGQLTVTGKVTPATAPAAVGSVIPIYQDSILDKVARFLGRNWLQITAVGLGIFSITPWLAPIFAALGWWGIADPIYTIYAIQCHQLPERAPHIFGYEVCQCWRCAALYGGMFLFTGAFIRLRRGNGSTSRFFKNPLPAWIFVLLLLPMAIDGFSHMFGARDTFDMTTPSVFGAFDVGSQVGSLNWILRISTGLLAAVASVWFSMPRIQRAMDEAEALRTIYIQSGRRAG